MKVFLYERQLIMPGWATYFPLATGLLAAYAKKHLPGWEFFVNYPKMEADSIVAFSVSSWNLNFSLRFAGGVKRWFPKNRIIFGGPSAEAVKMDGAEIIIGEGEASFLRSISGIETEIKTLDDIPSPYLSGVFDEVRGNQAIIETSRGCPFGCAYCFWGKGDRRMKYHSLEYVKAEAEWMGINKIPYVFCADGNFGMFARDVKIAEIYAEVKRKYGYPEKFRVCYGKNATKTIFETARVLNDAGLSKSVTMSPQSRNPETLAAIGRSNIKDSFFDEMQKKYDDAGIPVYSELILGLPCETFDSFKDGLIKTMRSGNQLFVYMCEALPSTKLADEEYKKRYGIITRRVPLTPAHCAPLDPEEFEDIVVGTDAMPAEDWMRAAVLGWMVQLYYSFKAMDADPEYIIEFCLERMAGSSPIIKYFRKKAREVFYGLGRCDLIDGIYFEPEEVVYLKYFCEKGDDPLKQIIHARKNNFKKEEMNCER